jgi:hypothetical protein
MRRVDFIRWACCTGLVAILFYWLWAFVKMDALWLRDITEWSEGSRMMLAVWMFESVLIGGLAALVIRSRAL